jgi:hypothetical protein
VAGVTHSVLYLTARNDIVYAYDADSYGSGSPPGGLYWSASLVDDCAETVSGSGVNYPGTLASLTGIVPYLGILSTPVIDGVNGIIYVVNACNVTGPTHTGMQWYLNALRLGSGKPAVPPVMIAGAVTNSFGTTTFMPGIQLQRAALLLTRNATAQPDIYIAFGAGTVEGASQAA